MHLWTQSKSWKDGWGEYRRYYRFFNRSLFYKSKFFIFYSISPPWQLTNLAIQSIDLWDGERVDYDISANACGAGKVCGHYTQIAWNTTQQVGCGWKVCTSNSPFSSGGTWTYTVCNYYPAGNLVPSGSSVPRKPYAYGGSTCVPSCPANACGNVTSCGQTISCSCNSDQYCNSGTCTACTNPCTSGKCGVLKSATCPTKSFTCSACATGQTCESNGIPHPFPPLSLSLSF